MNGPLGLGDALLKHKDAFLLSFTERLMTYATGRRMQPFDMPMVRRILREAGTHDYKLSAFILGIVKAPAFTMNRVEPRSRAWSQACCSAPRIVRSSPSRAGQSASPPPHGAGSRYWRTISS